MMSRRFKEKFLHIRGQDDSLNTQESLSDCRSENPTLFQSFEWYLSSDGTHYQRLAGALDHLKDLGVDQIWLPPGCKAGWIWSNCYDVYDAYDLGEFDQKGWLRTKFGSKEDLMSLSKRAQDLGIGLCWDAILNHRCAADFTEKCQAVMVDAEDRRKDIGEPHEVEVWTGYNFDARDDKYSSFKYRWYHFTGTDWEASLQTNENIYRFLGDGKHGWAKDVDDTLGNYDYLMGNDLDHSHSEVRTDLNDWAKWIVKEVGLSGFRLDAVKHMSQSFLKDWIQNLDREVIEPLFFVGEYWREDLNVLGPMIERFEGRLCLFDVALAGNMSKISHNLENSDLREILQNTLMEHYPSQAVTFVLNHDTQPRYKRDHHVIPISPWFIPLGYAIILLMKTSAYPCVFYGDLYGIQSPDPKEKPHLAQPPSCWGTLHRLMLARRLWAFGEERQYFDEPSCIEFVRSGLDVNSSQGEALVAILNIATWYSHKHSFVGDRKRNKKFTDLLGFAWGEVKIDEEGWGIFPVGPRSVGVWLDIDAVGRKEAMIIASKSLNAK